MKFVDFLGDNVTCKSYAFLKLVDETSDEITKQLMRLESMDFELNRYDCTLKSVVSSEEKEQKPFEVSNETFPEPVPEELNKVEPFQLNQSEIDEIEPPPIENFNEIPTDQVNFVTNRLELSQDAFKPKPDTEKMFTFQKLRQMFMSK